MPAKHAITAAIAVIAHGATAAFNTSCSWWYIHDKVTLTGDCVDSTSSTRARVVSNLDLNECIGVDTTANAMVWQTRCVQGLLRNPDTWQPALPVLVQKDPS